MPVIDIYSTNEVGYIAFQCPGHEHYHIQSECARVEVLDVTEEFTAERLIAPNGADSGPLFDRAPLRLTAQVNADNGESYPLTVLVNHNLSLLQVNSLTARTDSWLNDGNRSRTKRARQAMKVAQWVEAMQTVDPEQKLVLIGDFNAFDFNDGYVDVMGVIAGHPAAANEVLVPAESAVSRPLTNLSGASSDDQGYSYVFEGNSQSLDHALVNQAVLDSGEVAMHHARLNADFAVDHAGDAGVPMRTSDHDPLVVDVRVPEFIDADVAVTLAGPSLPVLSGERVSYALTVANPGLDDALQTTLELRFNVAADQLKQVTAPGWLCGAPVATAASSISLACERSATLAAGVSDALSVEVQALRRLPRDTLSVDAVVTTRSHDTDAGNNAAATSTLLVGVPGR